MSSFRPDGPEPPHFGAVDLHMDMLLMVLHVRVTLSCLKRMDIHMFIGHLHKRSASSESRVFLHVSDSDGSESASDSEQNDSASSLVADTEQYELMQRAYAAVGEDFTGKDDLIGSTQCKLQKLEMVPERWPLAQLSFSLQTCVDHLDCVLAGCC